jgi:DNA/RNA endonuclease YhcR with UshA esterase domain
MIRRLHPVAILLLATFLVPDLRAQGTDSVRPIRTIAADGTNERVTIAGRATASAGQMQSGAFEVALQDPSGGIRIFSRVLDVPIREGDSLIATGTVKRYRGDLELVATQVTVVPSTPRVIQPREVSIDVEEMERHHGQLVLVRGRVDGLGYS